MSKEYMTTFEMLAVSPITLTIRQSEVQKELVGGTISKKLYVWTQNIRFLVR
ncbi:hypothetical protein FORC47_p197 (plasmid) [Bacillus cereus]|nr:hypothetical protein FORC47_p197 [Bacillus cereus]